MAKTHDVKIWVRYFDEVRRGIKTFEIRKDDRNYEVGDLLVLNEFKHMVGEYTGRKLERRIIYIARASDEPGDAQALGLQSGYVVLGLGLEKT